MFRFRTILVCLGFICLLISGCATGPINPAEEWNEAKNKNTFESYVNFLESHAKSEFAPQAKQKLKAMMKETALNSISGKRSAIRKGDEFPLNIFDLDDLLKSFAQNNLPVSFNVFSKSANDPNIKHSEGFQDLKNFKAWEPFYAQVVTNQKNTAEASIIVMVWLIPLKATAFSTTSPDTSVTFYRDPDQIGNRAFGIVIKKELVKGLVEKERINITGVGMAIVKSSGFVWVYDFSLGGKSIFNE